MSRQINGVKFYFALLSHTQMENTIMKIKSKWWALNKFSSIFETNPPSYCVLYNWYLSSLNHLWNIFINSVTSNGTPLPKISNATNLFPSNQQCSGFIESIGICY